VDFFAAAGQANESLQLKLKLKPQANVLEMWYQIM